MRLPYLWNGIAGTRVTVFVETMAGVDDDVRQAAAAGFLKITGDQETTYTCNAALFFDPEKLGEPGKTVAGTRFAKKSTAGRGDTLPDPALDGSPSTIVLLVKARPIKHQVGAGLSQE
ncbi:hypothetical protein [Roseovarius sp. SYSU LYC5161]|uniref:hypothetical protein n=1 Tax=Roseovarius halophilus (ex Wu et al. 2025) TaxID=3376060 RepID=UPI00399C4A29